jgi:glucose-1-phosphate cytidylyltransferase
MKVLILAGGSGTRLGEETSVRPKPMVEIGGRPILWHIMKLYSFYGFREFVVLLGYKGYVIKEYFANYFLHQSDITIDLETNQVQVHSNSREPWKVTLLDTGADTLTGGRILRAREYVDHETFMLTYGDGVADINLKDLLAFHRAQGCAATMTTVRPFGRFGMVTLDPQDRVVTFLEKPARDSTHINGGFFVLEPAVFDCIEGDHIMWEGPPLEVLARKGQLAAYRHDGFWMCMDTLRDKVEMERQWQTGQAAWKIWE